MNIELVDYYRTAIQATFFNDAVDKFEPKLKENSVYLFSKGTVKPANTKFTSIKNEYSLTFGPYAEITEVKDEGDIDEISFDFVPLSKVKSMV